MSVKQVFGRRMISMPRKIGAKKKKDEVQRGTKPPGFSPIVVDYEAAMLQGVDAQRIVVILCESEVYGFLFIGSGSVHDNCANVGHPHLYANLMCRRTWN